MQHMNSITEQLRAEIAKAEQRGMSRYAIAKAAGLPYSQVYNVAEGTIPRLDTAEKIARALGLPLYLNSDTIHGAQKGVHHVKANRPCRQAAISRNRNHSIGNEPAV